MVLSTGECRVPAGCWGWFCPIFLDLRCPEPLGGQRTQLPAPLSPIPRRFFCSCPNSSCSYGRCSYFKMILRCVSKPLYSLDSLCLSSQTRRASTQDALALIPASAHGAALTPLLTPVSQRSSQNTPYGGGGHKLAVNSPFPTTLQETSLFHTALPLCA